MDNDLDRSVRLLDDALSTTGRGLFKKNTHKRDRPNTSITLLNHEISNLLYTSKFYDETITTILDADKSAMGTVIQANTPWKTAVNSLYSEFFEIMQSHPGTHDILEFVTDLSRCCSDALKVVQSLKSKVAFSQLEEEKWLENERNTWKLLFILYQDRLLTQNLMDDDEQQYFGKSEKLCIENLFKRDNLLRESQLVIDWLERNAAERDDQILHFSDSTVGWENTLHQLQSAETIAFGSSRQIINYMDPDAPHYQNKPLHDLDADDEKRLEHRIFTEIRCGRLEEAQKLCRQCGHSWRAAIFEGWRLFHNPNIKESDNEKSSSESSENFQDEFQDLEGNRSRDIWKIMAMKYCKQEYLSAYEKAAIASYCGYIDGILPVCNTWEDNLWAYMKSLVDIRVESEVRDCCIADDNFIPLPNDYWAQRMSLNEVFENLESSKKNLVREESHNPEHIIQKYIILDELPQLLKTLEEWVSDSTISTQFLRFLAHLVLFLDQIGQGQNREIVEKILEAYIGRLIEMKETQLVAFYVSKMNASSQVLLYASYLEKIVNDDERKESLIFAENCGLNVFSITKQVVENIRNIPDEIEPSGNLQHKITSVDKFKISGLDWIIFYDNQRTEALIQANALIFTFLTLGKLDAAQLAFDKIPTGCIKQIQSEGDVSTEIAKVVKEYLCYKEYLDAHEAFNEWFQQYKNKPLPPNSLPEGAQFPERVAHEHRVSQFEVETERWKLTTSHLAEIAKNKLYNVLLFPEGWLTGAEKADYLRSTCIPEIVLLLYSVLYETGLYEECIQLADVLAAEKYCLYKVYSKEKLGEILVKLCESSVALLNAKKDPWGNEPSVQ